MTFNITTDGTTAIELVPLQHYIASVEGTFGGAEVKVQSTGGVLYLPFSGSDTSVTSPNACEFRAISASGSLIVSSASGTTDMVVRIAKIKPSTRG